MKNLKFKTLNASEMKNVKGGNAATARCNQETNETVKVDSCSRADIEAACGEITINNICFP